jgi:hypothetical protein
LSTNRIPSITQSKNAGDRKTIVFVNTSSKIEENERRREFGRKTEVWKTAVIKYVGSRWSLFGHQNGSWENGGSGNVDYE